ncbi:hypothetical protein [Nocardioides daejeonensis]|uniref:hypothetical protein n=1 Tax=Nocardioides daejeonensis TaxID=1046556 RepID=UPI000D74C845|nr:hypothetical protein [Nocardioides daejeonensis]
MAEVVPDKIRAAAGKMATAATEARTHKPDEVGNVSTALPGSDSASAASTLSTEWKTRFTGWADDVDTHATSMRDSADDWDGADLAALAREERLARTMDGQY